LVSKLRPVCLYSNIAGNIALDYLVYFLKILFIKCTSLEQYYQLYCPSKSLCKPGLTLTKRGVTQMKFFWKIKKKSAIAYTLLQHKTMSIYYSVFFLCPKEKKIESFLLRVKFGLWKQSNDIR
jgi:hypothetical protein